MTNREELAGRLDKLARSVALFVPSAVEDMKAAAAALRQSPSVEEVAAIIRKHAMSSGGAPCTPRESVTAAEAIAALYGGERDG